MMRFFNWVGGIAMIVFFAWMVYAVNHYDNAPPNEYAKQMLTYLEDTYDEKFVFEEYFKGSKMFPRYLGTDMIRVHPQSKPNVSFYTVISDDGQSFEDYYIDAFYNHAFTEKYKQSILDSDSRKKYVQMHVRNPLISKDKSLLKQPLAAVVQTQLTPDLVYCYVVVAVKADDFKVANEAKILADTYATLMQSTAGDFQMNVGFVSEDNFDDAVEMTRVRHAFTVDLMLLEEGYLHNLIFQREEEPRDVEYFNNYLNSNY